MSRTSDPCPNNTRDPIYCSQMEAIPLVLILNLEHSRPMLWVSLEHQLVYNSPQPSAKQQCFVRCVHSGTHLVWALLLEVSMQGALHPQVWCRGPWSVPQEVWSQGLPETSGCRLDGRTGDLWLQAQRIGLDTGAEDRGCIQPGRSRV